MESDDKQYKVIISERAAEMLIQHVRFIAEVNILSAGHFREGIIEAASTLQHFPERNPWLSDQTLPMNRYQKMLFNNRYLLIYQIKDNTVFIDYILDCRQDYRWLL